ncbi:SIR2 family protein [Caenispirillum salinarum]|uniref:SIR2 family protein n=1 Tax=Caenispirillum salinarum TaxID=859058 RepID=UPI00384E7F44
MENWEGLLRRFADLTTRPYEFYRSQANSDLPEVASLIGRHLNPIWWDHDQFAESRDTYSRHCIDESSALKIEISRYIRNVVHTNNLEGLGLEEVNALKSVVVDGIITTNYDTFLEEVFPGFQPYIGQESLLFGSPQGVAEIYKIHGCCTDPNSLVLTDSDYKQFHKKNPYLAAKLLATFVEHPIIFLGYSLSDHNIVSILGEIVGCLDSKNIDKLKDRMIFVEWDETEEGVFEGSSITQNGVTIPVYRVRARSFIPVYASMSKIKRRFPAPLLRRLKEQVYDLVLSNDPGGRVFVKDIDQASKDEDIEVVFGVGAIRSLQDRGHVGLRRWDILRDVVFDGTSLDAQRVVELNIEDFLKGAKYVPIFKYIHEANMFDPAGNIDVSGFGPKLREAAQAGPSKFHPTGHWKRVYERDISPDDTLSDIVAKKGADGLLMMAPMVSPNSMSVDELQTFLKSIYDEYMADNQNRTHLSRLICYFDWIKYRYYRGFYPAK